MHACGPNYSLGRGGRLQLKISPVKVSPRPCLKKQTKERQRKDWGPASNGMGLPSKQEAFSSIPSTPKSKGKGSRTFTSMWNMFSLTRNRKVYFITMKRYQCSMLTSQIAKLGDKNHWEFAFLGSNLRKLTWYYNYSILHVRIRDRRNLLTEIFIKEALLLIIKRGKYLKY